MSDVAFRTSGGKDPERYLLELNAAAQPTAADLLYSLERQKTRILDRTERGVDVDENPFEPYSEKGPYYYYPNRHLGAGKAAIRARKASVKYILKKTIGYAEYAFEKGLSSVGGEKTKNGLGIKYESYADFKRTLGRIGVDLRGPRAPHMLQALIAVVEGGEGSLQGKLGIYGEAAGRASGHNSGYNPRWKGTHKRRFLGASDKDIADMQADIATQVRARFSK